MASASADGYLAILQVAGGLSARTGEEYEGALQEQALGFLQDEEDSEGEEGHQDVPYGTYMPQLEASPGLGGDQQDVCAPATRKRKPQSGQRDTASMNCIDCRKVRASWGLPIDMKKIWCSSCGRNHVREGARIIKTVGNGYCEDCLDRGAKYGMPIDWERDNSVTDRRGRPVGGRAPGKEKRCRWCRICAANHPGAVNNESSQRPEAIAARKNELQKRREARAVAKKERRRKTREEIKAGRMKAPASPCVPP